MTDTRTDYTRLSEACDKLSWNAETIKHFTLKPSNAALARAYVAIGNAKRWLLQADQLLTNETYVHKLDHALRQATIDVDHTNIEHVKGRNVIIIDGAFDINELRKHLLAS